MTVQELVQYCIDNSIQLNTQIAVRAKDDHFVTPECVSLEEPYFGNSEEGERWMRANAPHIDGEIDYENLPKFLILDSDD